MMASISFPVGESSACSVMETTRMPRRRSMDLKATACPLPGELPDQDLPEGGVGSPRFVQHPLKLGSIGDAAALGLVHVLPGDGIPVLLGVVPEGAC